MPPKVKITKEKIVSTAVDIIRKYGEQAVNARVIAKELDCSTQPIFSNFATMDELHLAVVNAANLIYQEYTRKEIESKKYPAYKATGMAYIRFARQEKELFKLLFMRDRTSEQVSVESAQMGEIFQMVQDSTGLTKNKSELFHLEMWSFVHGLATMTATDYLELDMELMSQMLTDIYQGTKNRFVVEE